MNGKCKEIHTLLKDVKNITINSYFHREKVLYSSNSQMLPVKLLTYKPFLHKLKNKFHLNFI